MTQENASFQPAPTVIAMVRDLLFASRITSTAGALAVPVRVVRDPGQLESVGGILMLADLNQPGVIEAAAMWKRSEVSRDVVGFVSHVDRETIERARAAGIERVMARSAFVASLEGLLRGSVTKAG